MRHCLHCILLIYLTLLPRELFAQETENLVLNGHSMIFHETDGVAYIFGGATESEVINKLWTVETDRISLVNTSNAPEGRTFASMTYHKRQSAIFLFGGSSVLFGDGPDNGDLKNDTWLFKNKQWTKLNPTHSPKPRAHAAIAYDSIRDRIVLFGGYEIVDGEYVQLGDTWEFYNGDWHLVATTGPSPRIGAAMIFNSQQIVLFGGSTASKDYGNATGETWTWDGKEWAKRNIDQPANVFDATMAYDPDKKRILRFGGWNGKGRSQETWIYTGNWLHKDELANSPAARNHSQMVYDSSNKRMLLFGGHNGPCVFGDLWAFDDSGWKQIISDSPRKRVRNQH